MKNLLTLYPSIVRNNYPTKSLSGDYDWGICSG